MEDKKFKKFVVGFILILTGLWFIRFIFGLILNIFNKKRRKEEYMAKAKQQNENWEVIENMMNSTNEKAEELINK